MKATLQMGLKQQLALTPKLRQAIKLLQLSSLELEHEIKLVLEMNPFLEQEEPLDPKNNEEYEEFDSETLSNDAWEDLHQYFNSPSSSALQQDFILQQGTETTLHSHLLWQMELAPFTEKERAIASIIIDSISDDGYLTCTLKEIQDSLCRQDIALSEIESVLNVVQQFDPIGIGARNLTECLTIQLANLPPHIPLLEEAKILTNHYLDLLGKRDYTQLCDSLNISSTTLESAIKLLVSLNPRPGTGILTNKDPEYIIPDLIVKKKNGQYSVQLNREFTPRIRVNTRFESLIRSQGETNSLREQWNEARWLIKTIKTRNKILLTVARSIIEAQEEFLEGGEERMKPLNLQDIAQCVGLHESTISRVTTHKYILTPRGVFELKFFFSNGVQSSNLRNTPTSSSSIRALIKKWINDEPRDKPLSDQLISTLLLQQGIKITRRTVTKYREIMAIPCSLHRKQVLLNSK